MIVHLAYTLVLSIEEVLDWSLEKEGEKTKEIILRI